MKRQETGPHSSADRSPPGSAQTPNASADRGVSQLLPSTRSSAPQVLRDHRNQQVARPLLSPSTTSHRCSPPASELERAILCLSATRLPPARRLDRER